VIVLITASNQHMRKGTATRWRFLWPAAATLLVWTLASEIARSAFIPSPFAIAAQLWVDRADYLPHLVATISSATVGFAIGNGAAAVLAVLFLFVPELRGLMTPLTFVFSIPLILLVPIIGMAFSPELTKVMCAALLVYYPTLLITSVGLENADPALVNVVLVSGGGRAAIFRKVRIRYGLAALAAGLQAAAPLAILGSMLGELTGARWGLGSYLLATMAQAKPAKEWGIFFVCSGTAALAYRLVGVFLRPLRAPFTATEGRKDTVGSANSSRAPWSHLTASLAGWFLAIVAWQGSTTLLKNPYFEKGPIQIFEFGLLLPRDRWSDLGYAFVETLKWAGLGLLVGLGSAFLLAIILDLYPALSPAVLPLALISQAVPIIAFIPLIVAIFGRGLLTTLAVTVSATFFPSFVTIHQGFQRTPVALTDVLRAAGASNICVLSKAKLPNALPFAGAAARLTAPRVLLGITLAEYLATRSGLGSLMFEARGTLDFGMLWLIAVMTGVVSILFYYGIYYLELGIARRYGVSGVAV